MAAAIFILCALPLLAAGFTAWNRAPRRNHLATLGTAGAHLAVTVRLLITGENPFPAGGWFALDPLGAFFLLILSHTFVAVVLCSPGFLRTMGDPELAASRRLYYPALNLYLLAGTLVIITQHFGLMWVVLELTTFSLSPLIYFYRSAEALEAAWKYLFLVSLGLVFLLIGILFLGLAAKGVPGHPDIVVDQLVRHAAQLNPLWVKASFVLALVGISAKIGLAPMHPADIDATSNAPAPVAALMAGSLRSTALLVLLRFYQVVCPTSVRPLAENLLIIAGSLSLAVAAIYIWRARNYKRLLAYSSVEHLGLIVLSLGVGGVAFLGALLHTLFNSLGKFALFTMAGRIRREFQSRQIDSIHGLMGRLPWTGLTFGLAFFFIVGTPPFGIFFSELMMLRGMIHACDWIVLAIFLSLLMVIFLGMSRAALRMLQAPPSPDSPPVDDRPEPFQLVHAVSLYALAISVPIAICQPQFLFAPLRAIVAQFGFPP